MKIKSAPVRFKADGVDTGDAGTFEAVVSVFGNVDSWGDVVQPGAFKESIDRWKSSPNTLPVLWSHRMDDPLFNIGEVLDIDEFEPGRELPEWVDPAVKENGGLWVHGRIDTGADASPIAVHALRLMKARRVTQFSYAYDELDAGWGKSDGREVWELRKLRLYEISPTQIGANELTELVAAKAARVRMHVAGKSLSQEDADGIGQAMERLNEAAGLLGAILDSSSEGDADSEKAKDEEPSGVKSGGVSPESTNGEIARLLADSDLAEEQGKP